MTFVDTNLLIRIITNDVPVLHDKAVEILASRTQAGVFISDIVFTELFFVLEHDPQYRYTRQEVCGSIGELLAMAPFRVSEAFAAAFQIAEKHPKLDFTDCLLAIYADRQTTQLLTFDKNLQKILK